MVNTKEVKVWMIRSDFKIEEIARLARTVNSTVYAIIKNERNPGTETGKRVIQALKKLGCPGEILEVEEKVA
jgi:hypothetical protein